MLEFLSYNFIQNALFAVLIIACAAVPYGSLLVGRKMGLMADSLSHSILPGVAVAYMLSNASFFFMLTGGILSGILTTFFFIYGKKSCQNTHDDGHIISLYLFSTALGVVLISLKQKQVDLLHIMFGSILGINTDMVFLLLAVVTILILIYLFFYKYFLIGSYDEDFLLEMGLSKNNQQFLFFSMIVIISVTGFVIFGTTLFLGILILPTLFSKLFTDSEWLKNLIGIVYVLFSAFLGLLASFYFNLAAGPAIILIMGGIYFMSKLSQSVFVKFFVFVLMIVSMSNISYAANKTRPKIVTSFSILENLVEEIAGDKVEVYSLVGANQDAHVYNPTVQDRVKINEADLLIYNGFLFEPWFLKMLSEKSPTLVASKGIVPLKTNTGEIDPHAWHSITNVLIYIDNICQKLGYLLPEERKDFIKKAEDLKQKITNVSRIYHQKFDKLNSHKMILTSHDAFQYLGHEFGLIFLAPQGVSTETTPSAQDVVRIIKQIKEQKIKAVFMENLASEHQLNTIAAETKIKLNGTLFSDALGLPEEGADTYLKMMSSNLEKIYQAVNQ